MLQDRPASVDPETLTLEHIGGQEDMIVDIALDLAGAAR